MAFYRCGSVADADKYTLVNLGNVPTSNQIKVTSYPGYENFTKDNFIVELLGVGYGDATSEFPAESGPLLKIPGVTIGKTYKQSTGTLTLSNMTVTCSLYNQGGAALLTTVSARFNARVWLKY